MCKRQDKNNSNVRIGNLNESQNYRNAGRNNKHNAGNSSNHQPNGRNGSATETNKH